MASRSLKAKANAPARHHDDVDAALRIVTALRLGDCRLLTGLDGVYASLFDDTPNECPQEADPNLDWGAGAFGRIEYLVIRPRGLPL